MSPALRRQLSIDPEYTRCAFAGIDHPAGPCAGRITREHAIIYAGKKIQERWAIIPCCAKHHAVDEYQDAGTMNKRMNKWAALNRATDEDLAKYDRANYKQERDLLNREFGPYEPRKTKEECRCY